MASAARFRWKPGHHPSNLADKVEIFKTQIRSKAIRTSESTAEQMVQWMRANAPWNDDTGNARRDLYARATRTGELGQGRFIVIEFGHGPEIYYGIYLETMQGGRFAIVGPTIDYWSAIWFQNLTSR